jgi:hypothetical protein
MFSTFPPQFVNYNKNYWKVPKDEAFDVLFFNINRFYLGRQRRKKFSNLKIDANIRNFVFKAHAECELTKFAHAKRVLL